MNFITRKLVLGAKLGNNENDYQRQPIQHINFQFQAVHKETDRDTEISPSIINLQHIFNSSQLLSYFLVVVSVV